MMSHLAGLKKMEEGSRNLMAEVGAQLLKKMKIIVFLDSTSTAL
jgi:hypothetical protein